jgi:hypothetical protein
VRAPAESSSPDRDRRPDRPEVDQRPRPDPGATTGTAAPAAVQRLQRAAGNRAVTALLAKRRPGVTAPVPGGTSIQRLATTGTDDRPPSATEDPKFAALEADVHGKRKLLSAHPSPSSEAAKAQGAAKPPQDDKQAQGKTANAEKMNAAKPGEFDKAGFIKAVNDAIAQQAPKNLDEADDFAGSGKAADVKGQVQGKVTDGKKTSAAAITTTTNRHGRRRRETGHPAPTRPATGHPGHPGPVQGDPRQGTPLCDRFLGRAEAGQ